jgi:Na+/citrate or Na+/malate symporter
VTRAHKIANLIGVPLPLVGLVAAVVLLWNQAIGPLELGLLVGLYVLTALGVTLGTTGCSPIGRSSPAASSARSSRCSARWRWRAR